MRTTLAVLALAALLLAVGWTEGGTSSPPSPQSTCSDFGCQS